MVFSIVKTLINILAFLLILLLPYKMFSASSSPNIEQLQENVKYKYESIKCENLSTPIKIIKETEVNTGKSNVFYFPVFNFVDRKIDNQNGKTQLIIRMGIDKEKTDELSSTILQNNISIDGKKPISLLNIGEQVKVILVVGDDWSKKKEYSLNEFNYVIFPVRFNFEDKDKNYIEKQNLCIYLDIKGSFKYSRDFEINLPNIWKIWSENRTKFKHLTNVEFLKIYAEVLGKKDFYRSFIIDIESFKGNIEEDLNLKKELEQLGPKLFLEIETELIYYTINFIFDDPFGIARKGLADKLNEKGLPLDKKDKKLSRKQHQLWGEILNSYIKSLQLSVSNYDGFLKKILESKGCNIDKSGIATLLPTVKPKITFSFNLKEKPEFQMSPLLISSLQLNTNFIEPISKGKWSPLTISRIPNESYIPVSKGQEIKFKIIKPSEKYFWKGIVSKSEDSGIFTTTISEKYEIISYLKLPKIKEDSLLSSHKIYFKIVSEGEKISLDDSGIPIDEKIASYVGKEINNDKKSESIYSLKCDKTGKLYFWTLLESGYNSGGPLKCGTIIRTKSTWFGKLLAIIGSIVVNIVTGGVEGILSELTKMISSEAIDLIRETFLEINTEIVKECDLPFNYDESLLIAINQGNQQYDPDDEVEAGDPDTDQDLIDYYKYNPEYDGYSFEPHLSIFKGLNYAKVYMSVQF